MGDWSIANLTRVAAEQSSGNLTNWDQHASFFDDTVQALFAAKWVHPWENWRADFVRAGREFQAPKLLLPGYVAHLATDAAWPKGEPGSDSEAQSYCLNLMTSSVVRSLARSGYLAFCGLPTAGVGEHRRTVEAVVHVEVLVDRPDLAMECWRLAWQHSTRQRKSNGFRKHADLVYQQVIPNKKNYPDAKLSPLQRILRVSVDDAGLHLGPHAGVHHGAAGKNALGLNPFDVHQVDVGMYAWRFAAQLRTLVDALANKLPWLDAKAWQAASASLRARSATLEESEEKRRGFSPTPRPPWSSLP